MQDNNTQTDLQETQNALSFTDAVSGTFIFPGNTFTTIENTPKKNYWLFSIIICIVLGIISTFLFTNDSELVGEIMDKQKEKLYQSMDERVNSGQMSREEANTAIEQAEEFMSPESLFFKISAFGATIIMPFLSMLVYSLLGLVLIKIFKGSFLYVKLLGVIALGMIISSIGDVINVIISILTGDFTSLSLALALKDVEMPDSINTFLVSLSAFKIWSVAVVSLGIAKIGKVKTLPIVIIVLVVYIVYTFITSSMQ